MGRRVLTSSTSAVTGSLVEPSAEEGRLIANRRAPCGAKLKLTTGYERVAPRFSNPMSPMRKSHPKRGCGEWTFETSTEPEFVETAMTLPSLLRAVDRGIVLCGVWRVATFCPAVVHTPAVPPSSTTAMRAPLALNSASSGGVACWTTTGRPREPGCQSSIAPRVMTSTVSPEADRDSPVGISGSPRVLSIPPPMRRMIRCRRSVYAAYLPSALTEASTVFKPPF